MSLKKKETKESAVSPVVGVMLMLVVTIIIAAVVAAFAGSIVTSAEKAPNAILDVKLLKSVNVGVDWNNNEPIYAPDFTIDHISGDAVPVKDLAITFTWTNVSSNAVETYTYYPRDDTGINFKATTGISTYYSYGNYSMYLNGNPSADSFNATLKNGAHIQTAGNYIYDGNTTGWTIMTGNPFIDVIMTGKISATFDAANGVWSGGVMENIGESVHVTIAHIPTNLLIFDKEVKVQ